MIVRQSDEDNPKLKNANGVCEIYSKKIVLRNISEDNDPEAFENIEQYEDKVLRHEIIHAFLSESGLRSNSWADNEEMVDWFAIQIPKIAKLYKELDIL